jgi:hypothetical protein
VHMYELALEQGETSRETMARARSLGLDHLTATSVLDEAEIRALWPERGAGPLKVAKPATETPTSPTPAEEPSPRRRPIAALVAVAVVVVLAAGGAVVFMGSDDAPSDSTGTDRSTAADALTQITDAPGPTGPVAGTRFEKPTNIVDVEEFCTGWPPVAAYWAAASAVIVAGPDLTAVRDWTGRNSHRQATAGIEDHLIHAFGADGPVDEVMNVQRWVYDVALLDQEWDLETLRRATGNTVAAITALQTAADQAC